MSESVKQCPKLWDTSVWMDVTAKCFRNWYFSTFQKYFLYPCMTTMAVCGPVNTSECNVFNHIRKRACLQNKNWNSFSDPSSHQKIIAKKVYPGNTGGSCIPIGSTNESQNQPINQIIYTSNKHNLNIYKWAQERGIHNILCHL